MENSQAAGKKSRQVANWLLAVIAVIATLWFLQWSYLVTMPLAFAFFLAMLVHPVLRWLEHRFRRRFFLLSLTLTMLVLLGLLAGGLGLLWWAGTLVINQWPVYSQYFQQAWEKVVAWSGQHDIPLHHDLLSSTGFRVQILSLVGTFIQTIWSTLFLLVLVLFLVALMLIEWRDWRGKSQRAFGQQHPVVLETVDTIARKVRTVLLTQVSISILSGVTDGTWLWIAGVDLAFVWGMLFFLLNFIPNIGSVIAMIPPILIALVKFDTGWALVTVGVLVGLEQFTGNFLAPRLQGRTNQISSLVLLVSLLLWSWIWGVAGALMAIPITITVIITFLHVPSLKPIALLLSKSASETLEQDVTSQTQEKK